MKSRNNLQPSKSQSLIVHLVKELDDVLRVNTNPLAKYSSRAQKLDFSIKGSVKDRILEEKELYLSTAKCRKKVNTEVLSYTPYSQSGA